MTIASAVRARLWALAHRLLASGAPDPRAGQPPLPLPPGVSRERILESLASIRIDGSAKGELEGYARIDCERFLHTLALLPQPPVVRALEIGAGPYFTSLLALWYRPDIAWEYTNYFDGPVEMRAQHVEIERPDGALEQRDFPYWNVNLEKDRVPVEDARYDLVLFCEILEHMTHDPLACLVEIRRLLKPGGRLILTTPNVARLENVARLALGENLYDPYSGYGPYGRHNREYTQRELHALLVHAGFTVESSFTADVHANAAVHAVPPALLQGLAGWRTGTLGQYHFIRAVRDGEAETRKPTWLYRSYPAELLVERNT